jgi:hypothetical protein
MLAQTLRTRIFTQQFPGILTRGHLHLSQKLNSIQKNLTIRSLQYFSRAKNVFPLLHAAKFKVRFVGRGFSRDANALAGFRPLAPECCNFLLKFVRRKKSIGCY